MEAINNNLRGTDNNMASVNTKPSKPENKNNVSDESTISNEQAVDIKKISRDGDTLEISTNGEKQSMQMRRESVNDKLIISESEKKSDAELSSCSKAQLKQLYNARRITKQQYEKFMKSADK